MGGTPTTLIARWPSANPQSAVPLLAKSIGTKGGLSQGRRAVQIRSLRLPASETNGKEGRNMNIVRSLDGTSEKVDVVVEDPAVVGKKRASKGKGKAKQEDGDEVMIVEAESGVQADDHSHGRWTFSSVALPSGSSFSSSSAFPSPAALFDTFIQRTLFAQPPPGSAPGQTGTPSGGFWQPRAAAVTIEGFSFTVGSNAAGATGDWEVKVGSVLIKGGTSAGTAKGCIIEVSYLPVPYLPANSTYVKDFLLSLFPPVAVRNGEIEIVEVSEETFQDAGLLDPPDKEKGEEEGEWEWRDKHTSLTYVTQFKKEGIL